MVDHPEAAEWLRAFELAVETSLTSRAWTRLAHSFVQLGMDPVLPLSARRQKYYDEWQTWPEDDLEGRWGVLAWMALNQGQFNDALKSIIAKYPTCRIALRRVLQRDLKTQGSLEGFGRIVQHSYGRWLLAAVL